MEHKLYTAWIDVEDEVPFEDGNYLVAYDSAGMVTSPFTKNIGVMYFDIENSMWHDLSNVWKVTHWMALPSPPGNDEQCQHAKCAVCHMDIFKEPGCKWQHKGGQSFFIDAYGAHMPEPRNEQTEG